MSLSALMTFSVLSVVPVGVRASAADGRPVACAPQAVTLAGRVVLPASESGSGASNDGPGKGRYPAGMDLSTDRLETRRAWEEWTAEAPGTGDGCRACLRGKYWEMT